MAVASHGIKAHITLEVTACPTCHHVAALVLDEFPLALITTSDECSRHGLFNPMPTMDLVVFDILRAGNWNMRDQFNFNSDRSL